MNSKDVRTASNTLAAAFMASIARGVAVVLGHKDYALVEREWFDGLVDDDHFVAISSRSRDPKHAALAAKMVAACQA